MYTQIESFIMTTPDELHCTQDPINGEWAVWFPHPLGGMSVLETFDNEIEARQFWQDQIDSADYND
jgi:hypothetical protein